MSALTVFADTNGTERLLHTTDGDEITAALKDRGVRFERWNADRVLDPDSDHDAILTAYRSHIDRLVAERGYQTCDVVALSPEHPDRVALRAKFLSEHTHGEDEVRFFVEGAGLFCLHLGDRVYQVLCEKNDLISVPAGAKHWFDMGPTPRFVAIRLFNNPEGWVAAFTGSDIAESFPFYE